MPRWGQSSLDRGLLGKACAAWMFDFLTKLKEGAGKIHQAFVPFPGLHATHGRNYPAL
jgi:hypothetical protein